jgi:hypothetical protein
MYIVCTSTRSVFSSKTKVSSLDTKSLPVTLKCALPNVKNIKMAPLQGCLRCVLLPGYSPVHGCIPQESGRTHTTVLTPLTSTEYNEGHPKWTEEHKYAFVGIEALMVSCKCLTIINHVNMGENKIFITTDASDCRISAMLSWGPSWESARPVSFNSMQLSPIQYNYPVCEKEMLTIVHTLEKWQNEVLSCPITVYIDYQTLEYFESQKHLSQCQAYWQKFMSQFEIKIVYIKGEDNTMADALSHLPDDETDQISDANDELVSNHEAWQASTSATILNISADTKFLNNICHSYTTDPFCIKMISFKSSFFFFLIANSS